MRPVCVRNKGCIEAPGTGIVEHMFSWHRWPLHAKTVWYTEAKNPQHPFSFLNGHWEAWTDLPSWHINNRLRDSTTQCCRFLLCFLWLRWSFRTGRLPFKIFLNLQYLTVLSVARAQNCFKHYTLAVGVVFEYWKTKCKPFMISKTSEIDCVCTFCFKCIVHYQILMPRLLFPPQLKKLLLSPPNVPAGLESHKDGSVHRHSSRSQHVKPVRPVLKVRGSSSHSDCSINSEHVEKKKMTHNRKWI